MRMSYLYSGMKFRSLARASSDRPELALNFIYDIYAKGIDYSTLCVRSMNIEVWHQC
jgi:hypothetical protein